MTKRKTPRWNRLSDWRVWGAAFIIIAVAEVLELVV